MAKSFIKSVFPVLAVLALASCSKTAEFQHNPDSMLQIASVSGISPFDLMQNQASKAVITGDSLPGDEAAKGIGLFVTASLIFNTPFHGTLSMVSAATMRSACTSSRTMSVRRTASIGTTPILSVSSQMYNKTTISYENSEQYNSHIHRAEG